MEGVTSPGLQHGRCWPMPPQVVATPRDLRPYLEGFGRPPMSPLSPSDQARAAAHSCLRARTPLSPCPATALPPTRFIQHSSTQHSLHLASPPAGGGLLRGWWSGRQRRLRGSCPAAASRVWLLPGPAGELGHRGGAAPGPGRPHLPPQPGEPPTLGWGRRGCGRGVAGGRPGRGLRQPPMMECRRRVQWA